MNLAFVGGTGPEGIGLAIRLAAAGHAIRIGSRSQERGEVGAATVRSAVPDSDVGGGTNVSVLASADVVFLAFPFSALAPTLAALAPQLTGKIVCSLVAPLQFVKGKGAVAEAVEGNSAAEEAAALLPDSRVVSAFQNMAAERLKDLAEPVPADVLVCGADLAAKLLIIGLADEIEGVRGIDGGGLANSRYVEMLTSLLINLNIKHKTETSIKIVGIGD